MSEKNKNFVGVTGISSIEQAKDVIYLMREYGLNMQASHMPMMGFQTSYKSLANDDSEGNKRVPKLSKLPKLLEYVSGEVFATIHYYTNDSEKLVFEVDKLLRTGEIYSRRLVEGLQINMIWPSYDQLSEIKLRYPEMKLILQATPEVVNKLRTDETSKEIIKVCEHSDYVILDSSFGKGIEFNLTQILDSYNLFRQSGLKSNIIFAGGFHGNNVKANVLKLRRNIGNRDFSINAEGGLRDRLGTGYGNDLLNTGKVNDYLRGASEVLL